MIANDQVIEFFARLDLKSIALLLDVDGTIVDIGPSPAEVQVAPNLLTSLRSLSVLTDGAVALVSGRPVSNLDQLFSPLRLPSIGGHGAEMRIGNGETFHWAKPLPEQLRRQLAEAEKLGAGIVVEDKNYSLALHYRKAPQLAERLRHLVVAARKQFPDEPTELLLGKAVLEIKRPGVNKGESIRRLMAYSPFAGRVPVFIGDDVTDESVFRVLPDIGGKGFGVCRYFPGLSGVFASPAEVRSALESLAVNGQVRR